MTISLVPDFKTFTLNHFHYSKNHCVVAVQSKDLRYEQQSLIKKRRGYTREGFGREAV